MRVCVIDGRGGGLGRRLIAGLQGYVDGAHEIIALGTNQAAAAAMKTAGAVWVGVGERAIRRTVPTADVIVASLNVVLAGAMLGEVTPEIADAVLRAPVRKLLLPINCSQVEVVGAETYTLQRLIDHAIHRVQVVLSAAPIA